LSVFHQIILKLSSGVESGLRTNYSDFGGNSDQDQDPRLLNAKL